MTNFKRIKSGKWFFNKHGKNSKDNTFYIYRCFYQELKIGDRVILLDFRNGTPYEYECIITGFTDDLCNAEQL